MQDPLIPDPPDTPPTTSSSMKAAAAGGTILMATGAALLAMSTWIHLLLGFFQLASGAFILWWVISLCRRACEEQLAYHNRQLARFRSDLVGYHAWLTQKGAAAAGAKPPGGLPPGPAGSDGAQKGPSDG